MKGEELFQELLEYQHADWSVKVKYTRMNQLLDRVTKELTSHYAAEYTSLYARLFALCRQTRYKYRKPIEIFRLNARRVMKDEYQPNEHDQLFDFKAICEFISFFYQSPIPASIRKLLPEGWRDFPAEHAIYTDKRIRMVVESWDDHYIYGHDEEFPSDLPLQVDITQQNGFFLSLKDQIHTGTQLNLLDVKIGSESDGMVYIPRLIVLEPDYLIDISSLSGCLENYGCSELTYLYNKFRPSGTSHYAMLGNAANQFLDDLVNEKADAPANWRDSIQRNFRDYMLEYSVCSNIDNRYFEETQQQFRHLQSVVQQKFGDASVDINKNDALLEPSFFCEAMGLQGRLDLMLSDYSCIIELKSGKRDEFRNLAIPKHALQMALYQELLYYTLDKPRDQIRTFLLYSKYPYLIEQRTATRQIQQAIALRNAIVFQEERLRAGDAWEIFSHLTPEDFNQKGNNRFWMTYQYPAFDKFLRVFHQVSPLEAAYFNTFTQFLQREQFLSKMGDEQPDSGRGFAETWTSDVLTKQANGNILTDLTIQAFHHDRGIDRILLSIPEYDDGFLPNFRVGDPVILYQRNKVTDLATNHIVHRGCIIRITPSQLEMKLTFQQRNPVAFPTDSLYALEHDHMDSSTNSLYRGLYNFLQAPQKRRDLILCQRPPRTDTTRRLQGKYLNAVIDNLVQQAVQAQDYYLLVGPPGTGKTSIALRSMVQEFYATPGYNILLLSYTNRAVDEICEMLDTITPYVPYLRIGNEHNCDPRFRPHLLKNQCQGRTSRQGIQELFLAQRIIVSTVSSLAGQLHTLFQLKHFHVAIIDEASQILEPHLLTILSATDAEGKCAIDKFIMVGDHKQLPAVVVQRPEQSAVSDEMLHHIGLTNRRDSLFERLYRWVSTQNIPNIIGTLYRQGRMHPEVGEFANRHFYGGNLLPVPIRHQQEALEFRKHGKDFQEYVATTRFGFIHSDYPQLEENNKSNRGEARIVAAIVGSIYQLCLLNEMEFSPARRIGIIVPFRGQISMIRKELAHLHIPQTEEIVIDTVERFQGSQRDIMIFSTTISQSYQLDILSAPVEVDGVWVDRKLNVALTRARKQMFIVGNAHLLSRNPLYRELIDFAKH